MGALAVVRAVFADMSARKRANLRYHAKRKTRVACGAWANAFVSPEGFG